MASQFNIGACHLSICFSVFNGRSRTIFKKVKRHRPSSARTPRGRISRCAESRTSQQLGRRVSDELKPVLNEARGHSQLTLNYRVVGSSHSDDFKFDIMCSFITDNLPAALQTICESEFRLHFPLHLPISSFPEWEAIRGNSVWRRWTANLHFPFESVQRSRGNRKWCKITTGSSDINISPCIITFRCCFPWSCSPRRPPPPPPPPPSPPPLLVHLSATPTSWFILNPPLVLRGLSMPH